MMHAPLPEDFCQRQAGYGKPATGVQRPQRQNGKNMISWANSLAMTVPVLPFMSAPKHYRSATTLDSREIVAGLTRTKSVNLA